jgi:hypothetical protein
MKYSTQTEVGNGTIGPSGSEDSGYGIARQPAISTTALLDQLRSKRDALETEKRGCQDRIKAIDAELAALPKLPGERKARKKRSDAGSSKGEAKA